MNHWARLMHRNDDTLPALRKFLQYWYCKVGLKNAYDKLKAVSWRGSVTQLGQDIEEALDGEVRIPLYIQLVTLAGNLPAELQSWGGRKPEDFGSMEEALEYFRAGESYRDSWKRATLSAKPDRQSNRMERSSHQQSASLQGQQNFQGGRRGRERREPQREERWQAPRPREPSPFPRSTCYLCKGLGHQQRFCANNDPRNHRPGITCHRCHGHGHYAKDCSNAAAVDFNSAGNAPWQGKRAQALPNQQQAYEQARRQQQGRIENTASSGRPKEGSGPPRPAATGQFRLAMEITPREMREAELRKGLENKEEADWNKESPAKLSDEGAITREEKIAQSCQTVPQGERGHLYPRKDLEREEEHREPESKDTENHTPMFEGVRWTKWRLPDEDAEELRGEPGYPEQEKNYLKKQGEQQTLQQSGRATDKESEEKKMTGIMACCAAAPNWESKTSEIKGFPYPGDVPRQQLDVEHLTVIRIKIAGRHVGALLDTGCTHNLVDYELADDMQLQTQVLQTKLILKVGDGSPIEARTYIPNLKCSAGLLNFHINAAVAPVGFCVVLGMPFLRNEKLQWCFARNQLWAWRSKTRQVLPLLERDGVEKDLWPTLTTRTAGLREAAKDSHLTFMDELNKLGMPEAHVLVRPSPRGTRTSRPPRLGLGSKH